MDILLVEDDSSAREFLARYIEEQLFHHVTQCGDGLEALKLFKQKPFPMVISDIRMPGMSGIELLRRLKALPQGRNTDVVLVTGYGNMDTAIQALRNEAYDYLLKPINLEELDAVISRIAEHQALLFQISPKPPERHVSARYIPDSLILISET